MAAETPRCAIEFISADLREAAARRDVFAHAATQGPVLVITEGLLIYLTADQVADLARELHEIALAKYWLTDLASPMLLKFVERRWGRTLKQGNAPFQFGPAEGTAFFAPFGWDEAEFHSTWVESFRLNRTMPGAWLWQLLSKLQSKQRQEAGRRMSGIVLMEAI